MYNVVGLLMISPSTECSKRELRRKMRKGQPALDLLQLLYAKHENLHDEIG